MAPSEQPSEENIATHERAFEGVDGTVNVVIGHGRITGPEGLMRASSHYPGAAYVHFLHMDPKAIEWHKDVLSSDPAEIAEERAEFEVALGLKAKLIVAVGPELRARYSTYFHGDRLVQEFLPGLTPSDHQATPPAYPSCLLFGRAEDAELKGLIFASKAMAELNRQLGHSRTRLTIRGAQPGTAPALRRSLETAAGSSLVLDIENYTHDRAKLLAEIRSASLILMPSLEEGFGLTGLEAISEGVPVLLSAASGLAGALRKHLPRHANHHIFDVREGPAAMAKRMRTLLDHPDLAFDRVEMLRSAMRETFSWQKSAQSLLAQLRAFSPIDPVSGPQPAEDIPPRAPLAKRMQGYLLTASQGLRSWKQTLTKTGEWIDRPELARMTDHTRVTSNPPLVLVGSPGSGKSALLARLTAQLMDQGVAVLAIKADLLPAEVDSDTALEQHLGLPASIPEALDAVAAIQPVVLVIDQLDALADLVDLRSGRLNVLLALVRQIAEQGKVSIILSCRSFELDHDARLRSLNCERLHIQPLPIAGVAQLLKTHTPEMEPSARLLELLELPYNLDLYLNLTPTNCASTAIESHQSLIRERWTQCIEATGDEQLAEDCARQIAALIADREEFSLSLDLIKDCGMGKTVQRFLLCGLLVKVKVRNTDRVAFAHQTLFEFARARSFLSLASLPQYVKDRQESLFVRPILWTTLPYLRSADYHSYMRQLQELWNDESVRRHVHALLLAFLGQLQDPTESEITLFEKRLHDPKWQIEALRCIVKQQRWFEILFDTSLPGLLLGQHRGILVSLLACATDFAPEKVASLLDKSWFPQAERHGSIARVLQIADHWGADLAALCRRLVKAGALDVEETQLLVYRACSHEPEMAPELIAIELWRRLDAIPETSENIETATNEMRTSRDLIRGLVDTHSEFSEHIMQEAAEACPLRFVELLFPWFMRASERAAQRWEDSQYSNASFRDDDIPGSHGLAPVLRGAFCELAKDDCEHFLSLLKRWQVCETREVHNILAAALSCALPAAADFALEYLLADPRRLVLGGIVIQKGVVRDDPSKHSRELIAALSPHLNRLSCKRLEEALNASCIHSPSSGAEEMLHWQSVDNRAHRLGLLQSMERSRLSQEAVDEEASLQDVDTAADNHYGAILLASPMNADQMLMASHEEIVNLFHRLVTTGREEHQYGHHYWDVHARASYAFAEAAPRDPAKFSRLLFELGRGQNCDPVCMALETMGSSMPLEEMEALIHALEARDRLICPRRRGAAAAALSSSLSECRRTRTDVELSKETTILLEEWLRRAPIQEEPTSPRKRIRNDDEPATGPLLLGRDDVGRALPPGNWQILNTLTATYLGGATIKIEPWMRILEDHVKRDEDPEVWLAMRWDLSHVLLSKPERAERFLSELFTGYPIILRTSCGLQLIARAMSHLPLAAIQRWMEEIAGGEWERREQAFGELLALMATRSDATPWALQRLQHAMRGWTVTSDQQSWQILGVAHVAAALWHEPARRESTTALLVLLMTHGSGPVAEAAMRTFAIEELVWDEHTNRLLAALSRSPKVLSCNGYRSLFEELPKYVVTDPRLVADLATTLVDELACTGHPVVPDVGNALSDISLTLQRLDGEHRPRGLTLFEKLLDLDVEAAREALFALDRTRVMNSTSGRGIQQRSPKQRRKRT